VVPDRCFPAGAPLSPIPHDSDSSSAGPGERPLGLFGRYSLLFTAEVASRGLRFLADLLLVRHFGPAVFGQLNVAQSLAVQGTAIAGCGLDTAGMRDIAADNVAAPSIISTVVVLRLILGTLTWGLVVALSWLVPQYRDCVVFSAAYCLSLISGAVMVGWAAQGLGRTHVVGIATLTTHIVYFGGVQLAVHREWAPVAIPIVLVIAEILTAVALWVWTVRTIGPVRRAAALPAALRFLRQSLPIGAANLLRAFTVGSDVLLLGLFADKAGVGLYSGAFKLYSLGLACVMLYMTVLLPHLARCAAVSRPAVGIALRTALGRSLLVALPATLTGFFLARASLMILFGPRFDAATGILQVLLLAAFVNLIAGQYRTALVASGCQRQDLAAVAASAIAHVVAKLVLIPQFGAAGTACGTLLGEAMLMFTAMSLVRTTIRESRDGA